MTVVAPASATANGQAVQAVVPAQAHLAAALPPVVKTFAPQPVTRQPLPAWAPGRPLPNLPAGTAPTSHPAAAVAAPMTQPSHPAEAQPVVTAPKTAPHPAPPPKEGQRDEHEHARGHDPKDEHEHEQRSPSEQ